jgi:dTMP kinase
MAGKLFIFEGPDGVGKSSIVGELKLRLAHHTFEFLSFPGRDDGTLGKAIYRIHHTPEEFGISVMSALAKQALHVAAHIDVIETRIRPWIAGGKNVVLDRFWWSTVVYGSVGGGDLTALNHLIAAEQSVWGEVKPSAAFFVDRESPIDRDDEDLTVWRHLREEYALLASRESSGYPVFTIKNTASLTDAVNVAVASITNALTL